MAHRVISLGPDDLSDFGERRILARVVSHFEAASTI